MARRRRQEEHVNHESWAIPYGDLVTLLLAFFVVMYSISSVNDGKYRVLSDSLATAFNGRPKTMTPIQFGTRQMDRNEPDKSVSLLPLTTIEQSIGGTLRELRNTAVLPSPRQSLIATQQVHINGNTGYEEGGAAQLIVQQRNEALAQRLAEREREIERMSGQIQHALGELSQDDKVRVHRNGDKIEVEIGTDILFGSGSADVGPRARPVLSKLANVLSGFRTPLRIEGHTDNVPIHTVAFPSNWELSAARAASVVHLFMDSGVDPSRMSVAGYGEYRPLQSNDSDAGRNRNRRVVIVVLTAPEGMDPQLLDTSVPAVAADGVPAAGSTTVAASAARPGAGGTAKGEGKP